MNLLSVLFFASGCAALIYETVWFHLVQLVVGASSLSVGVLLCSFMGGMALGSALLPRLVPASIHPLRVVAALEAGIAAFGILIPLALPYVQQAYVAMVGYGYAGVLLRATACAVVLTPPTMLMGATLPAIARWFEQRTEAASSIGFLYTANIAGGAVGTVLAGFYLLRVYDTVVAGAVAVVINLLVALGAWWLASGRGTSTFALRASTFAPSASADKTVDKEVARDELVTNGTTHLVPIYVVAAMSGFTALGAEVVWTRQLSLLFGASVYTFSLILAVFLAGLGAGSLAGSSIARRSNDPAGALGRAQLLLAFAIAFGAWMIVHGLPLWQPTRSFLPWIRSSPPLTFAFDAIRCAIALMPATVLWGASFPLMLAAAPRLRSGQAGAADVARQVSRITALNTAGALVGTLSLTLIGIPMMGSQRSQQALVLMAARQRPRNSRARAARPRDRESSAPSPQR